MELREKIIINGIVQGVGFRPFVYTTAKKHNLTGFVCNSADGVVVEIQGSDYDILHFHQTLRSIPPLVSQIDSYQATEIEAKHESEFVIKESSRSQLAQTCISPDLTVCNDCLDELFDTKNRRYRYPFINCTNCGPRYSIIEGIPYDRPNTSMKHFNLCSLCEAEYKNPEDRRFHAQPNACPKCGPKIFCHDGTDIIQTSDPIKESIEQIANGKIVAIKGIGGFHLSVDPFNIDSIQKLRMRKNRPEKPFALMVKDIETVKKYCIVSSEEEKLLENTIRPILLLQKKETCPLPEQIAPNNNYLGIMIAYTPLHHLILNERFDTLIMTSANLSDEPIAIENEEAIKRLQNIADFFLLHDRPILQRCDDSIIRRDLPSNQIFRRSRGIAPKPVTGTKKLTSGIVALGGDQKNCISLSRNDDIFLSQYIGDLDNPMAFQFFKDSIIHLSQLLEIRLSYAACDMHPEYYSTKFAQKLDIPVLHIQHHHAHMVSVMAENNYYDKVIGIILDGTGYGTDGTLWGGELLVGDANEFKREAYLKPLPLPGSSLAIKEPYRMALSYLYSIYHNEIPAELESVQQIDKKKLDILYQMIAGNINSPLTSSCGRLFDAVASILNIRHINNYDAHAAIDLEMAAQHAAPMKVDPVREFKNEIDLSDLVVKIVDMKINNKAVSEIALYFHYALAEYFINAAINARQKFDINHAALSGGVFQNKILFEYMYKRLKEEKFHLLVHSKVPANDGGLPLGQTIIANSQLNNKIRG